MAWSEGVSGADIVVGEMSIARADITGLVLCGGRGARMGGVDKGLQPYRGQPLVAHAVQRLAPQVGPLMLSANRHLDTYRSLGLPVWPDLVEELDAAAGGASSGASFSPPLKLFSGPLAGWLAGLRQCRTPFFATVPCDSPNFPADLVSRLAAGVLHSRADLAIAVTAAHGIVRPQPVFCLLKASLLDTLADSLRKGERRIFGWVAGQHCVQVLFDDAAAFVNANTLDDLTRLQADGPA